MLQQSTGSHVRVIKNESEYEEVLQLMDQLINFTSDKKGHPLNELVEILGILIDNYEATYHQIPDSSPVELLKFLMEEHDLCQSGLPEIGSQGVVSEILSGKRELNLNHILALSKRFNIPSAVFLESFNRS